MSITYTWVTYSALSPFPIINNCESLLKEGTYKTGCWGPSTASNTIAADVPKFIIGLKFVGISANNIKIWLDTAYATIYSQSGSLIPNVDLATRSEGYKFKYSVVGESEIVFVKTDVIHGGDIYTCTPTGQVPQVLVSNTRNDYQPSPNIDGSKVAFISERNEGPRLHTMNANGTNVTLISSPGYSYADASPCYQLTTSSPIIAFSSNRSGKWQLYTIHDNASSLTRVTTNTYNDTAPFIDPTGTYIVFVSDQSGRPELWTCHMDGSSRTQITTMAGACSYPYWWNNGGSGRIAFASTASGTSQIYICNPDGSSVTQLIYSSNNDSSPTVSSDGTEIYFIRDGNIFKATIAGASITRLTNTSAQYANAKWSPVSGGRVYVDGFSDSATRDIIAIDPTQVYETEVTFSGVDNFDASWSYDQTLAVYVRSFTGYDEVWTMGTDYTPITQVTNHQAQCLNPHLSPDKTKVVYACNVSGSFNLYTKNADGTGSATRITSGLWNDLSPTWHPTNGTITFSTNRGGTYQIWKCNSDGTSAASFVASSYNDTEPRWNYAGTHLLFGRDEGSSSGKYHLVVNSSGGSPTVHESNTGYDEYQGSWSPDGTTIQYVRSLMNTPSHSQLYTVNYPFPMTVEGGSILLSAIGAYARPWASSTTNITFNSTNTNGVKSVETTIYGSVVVFSAVPQSNQFFTSSGSAFIRSPGNIRISPNGEFVSGSSLLAPGAVVSSVSTSSVLIYPETKVQYDDQVALQIADGSMLYSGTRNGIYRKLLVGKDAETQVLPSPYSGQQCKLFDVTADGTTAIFGIGVKIYTYVQSTGTVTLIHTAPDVVTSATTYHGGVSAVIFCAGNKLYQSTSATTRNTITLSDVYSIYGATDYNLYNVVFSINESPAPAYQLIVSGAYLPPSGAFHYLGLYTESGTSINSLASYDTSATTPLFSGARFKKNGASVFGGAYTLAYSTEYTSTPQTYRIDVDSSGVVVTTFTASVSVRLPSFLTASSYTDDILVSGLDTSGGAGQSIFHMTLDNTGPGTSYYQTYDVHHQLTNFSQNIDYICWSPDSTHVAYTSTNLYILQSSFVVATADFNTVNTQYTFDLSNTLTAGSPPIYLDWSSAVSKVLYVRSLTNGSIQNIYTINTDGTSPDTLLITNPDTSGSTSIRSPRYSPDGTKVAYITTISSGFSPLQCQLHVYDLGSSDDIILDTYTLPVSTTDRGPVVADITCAWSPDAAYIYYTADPIANSNNAGVVRVSTGVKITSNLLIWSENDEFLTTPSYGFDLSRTNNVAVYGQENFFNSLEYGEPGFSGTFIVASNTNDDMNGMYSPDGTKIVFDNNGTGQRQLYIMNADGTSVTRLITSLYDDSDPVLSPSGTQIAYVSNRPSSTGVDQGSNIWVANINLSTNTVSGATQLTQLSHQDSAPCWSSDGNTIYFVGTGRGTVYGTSNIFSVSATAGEFSGISHLIISGQYNNPNVNGTSMVVESIATQGLPVQNSILLFNLTNTSSSTFLGYGFRPQFKADASYIAFDSYDPTMPLGPSEPLGNTFIWTLNLSTSATTKLTDSGPSDMNPSWKPDGTALVFSSNRNGGQFDLYEVLSSGVVGSYLTINTVNESTPSWSPDGSNIVFVSDRTGTKQVFRVAPTSPPSLNLSANTHNDKDPTYTDDGTQIVFTSDRLNSSYFNLHVMGSDGSSPSAIETSSYINIEPSCHPTSNLIAFSSNRYGSYYQIHTIPLAGGSVVRLTSWSANNHQPQWSPDGTQIVFSSDKSGVNQIYVMESDGTNIVRLTQHSISSSRPTWSPDGTEIAYSRDYSDGTSQVCTVNTDGSNDVVLEVNGSSPNWSTSNYASSALTQHPMYWSDLPTDLADAVVLGNATMDIRGEAYSPMIALAVYAASGESNLDVRGMRIGMTCEPTI